MLDGFKEWFNKLSEGKKIALIIGIIAIITIIAIGIILLIVKLTKKREHFSYSDAYSPKDNKEHTVAKIAEAYTVAWIKSLTE